jgi:hypothetical protein
MDEDKELEEGVEEGEDIEEPEADDLDVDPDALGFEDGE